MEDNKDNSKVKQFVREWGEGKHWVDQFTRDFQDIDNLVDGVALNHSDRAPFVGSVTLGSALRMIARSAVQQLPTFSVEVNGTKRSTNSVFAKFILRRVVFNKDTFGKGVLSSIQLATLESLSHGFKAVSVSLGKALGDYGTSMQLIHYDDLVVEPGIFDFNESSHWDIRTRVTSSRIKQLIKTAKANPDTTWNVEELEALLANGPSEGNSYGSVLSEPRQNSSMYNKNTFDIITRYEAGPYGAITTFAPDGEKPLREMKSRSKFGYPRVSALVLDPSMISPFGTSRARLATPLMNYGNIYLQSTAKMLLLNSDPPVFQKGQFTTPIRLRRGASWQAIDPQSDVKLQELSNSTITQFQQVLNFIDSQIYSVLGVTPGAVGASSQQGGAYQNVAATNMEKNVSDVSNLEVVNVVENFLRQYALTALDLYISEQEGEEDVMVDDETKDEINRLAEAKFTPELDPTTGMPTQFEPPVGDDNTLHINWEVFYESIKSWTVDIDLSMAKEALDAKKRADAQDMLTVVSQTTDPNDPNAMARKAQLEDVMIEKTFPELQQTNPIQQQPALPMEGQPQQ